MPGFVIGILVALNVLLVSYGQVWLFAIVSGLAIPVLWSALEIRVNQPAALATWCIALAIGAFIPWAKPRVQFRRSGA